MFPPDLGPQLLELEEMLQRVGDRLPNIMNSLEWRHLEKPGDTGSWSIHIWV